MTDFHRRAAILGDLDIARLNGLEIGPLHNPLVDKSDGPIWYVDHADTDFIKQANRNPRFKDDAIVAIDIVWGDRPLSELVPHPMDYVVASHVIEHVPDMIGWLLDLRGALTDRGLICLAVPDRRFSFDLRRPESTPGEMVEAYLLRARRPPARHLFDQVSLCATFPKAAGWEENMLAELPDNADHAAARQLAERVAATTDYVDAHCWVFTPESFLNAAHALAEAGLFPFAIEYFHPTEHGDYEFCVRLRATDDAAQTAASIRDARGQLAASPSEQAYREMLLTKVYGRMLPDAAVQGAIRDFAAEKRYFAAEMNRRASEVEYLQSIVAAYEGSTCWRITRPLRWLGSLVKGKKAA